MKCSYQSSSNYNEQTEIQIHLGEMCPGMRSPRARAVRREAPLKRPQLLHLPPARPPPRYLPPDPTVPANPRFHLRADIISNEFGPLFVYSSRMKIN